MREKVTRGLAEGIEGMHWREGRELIQVAGSRAYWCMCGLPCLGVRVVGVVEVMHAAPAVRWRAGKACAGRVGPDMPFC